MIPVICLSILALALVVALHLQTRAFDRERQVLLDRIQVPEVAAAAAYARALPDRPAALDTDAEDDRAYGRPLHDDFDFIPGEA